MLPMLQRLAWRLLVGFRMSGSAEQGAQEETVGTVLRPSPYMLMKIR